MTKKILFIAKFSEDLKYFTSIASHIKTLGNAKVSMIFNIPIFFFEVFAIFRLTLIEKSVLDGIIWYDLNRKIAKHGNRFAWFFRILFSFLAKMYYIKYRNIVNDGGYDSICIWDKRSICDSIVLLIARERHIEIFHFGEGFFRDTVICDKLGMENPSSVPRYLEFYENIEVDDIFQYKNNAIEASRINPYVFISIPEDHFCQTWIRSFDDLCLTIDTIALSITSSRNVDYKIRFIIQKPENQLYTTRTTSDYITFVDCDCDVSEYIKNAKFVVTSDSKIGIQSLFFNARVLAIGDSFYSDLGFAYAVHDSAQLLSAIESSDPWSVDDVWIKKFLTYLYNTYLIHGDWREPSVEHIESIIHRIC